MKWRDEIVIGALNVRANPHPHGVYVEMLGMAATGEARIWGSDFGKITAPEPYEKDPNIYLGRVLIWTHIKKDGDWIDKKKNDRATEEDKKKIVIPSQLEPNYRSFHYSLNVKKHLIILEYKNDHGESLGPARALRLFSDLLSPRVLGQDAPEIDVTVMPEDGTVDKILHIPRLRRLVIHLERVNADDLTDDVNRIIGGMISQGAKSQDVILAKAPKIDSLMPSPETITAAKVAAENGYVAGAGRDLAGEPIEVSTKQHPKRVVVPLEKEQSSFAKFVSAIKFF